MGYRYISSTKGTIDKTDLILLKNKLTNDIEAISTDYGSSKEVSYSVPPSTELCLVDLDKNKKNNILQNNELNPLIKDSIKSDVNKNAFIIGDSIFEAYFIGDIEIDKDPYFICLKPVAGKVDFVIEGLGNKALIKE